MSSSLFLSLLLTLALVPPSAFGRRLAWNRPGLPYAPYTGRGPQMVCMATKCSAAIAACLGDPVCRTIMACNVKCKLTDASCFFICEVTFGIECTKYQDMADCMVENNCLPPFEPDGKCRVTDVDGLETERDVSSIAGDWWVIRGLNPHYDSYACQHNIYMQLPDRTWINNVTFMNKYHKPPILIRAEPIVTVTYPGVYLHNYTSLRQLESWVVVSRPRRDYLFMLWCGQNKELSYAGGIVMSPNRDHRAMPKPVEMEFRATAERFGLHYDRDLFANDNTKCEN